jgi:hypothetical protein
LALISLSASRRSVVAACRVEPSHIQQVYDEIKVSLLLIVSVLDEQLLIGTNVIHDQILPGITRMALYVSG